ncbi:MAG: glycosyltransferase [Pyrinomonadaceae bacterium]
MGKRREEGLMGGLRVLITNHGMEQRAGTELYVRDLALGLLERGHTPVVYTARVGEAARELRRATIPVVDDLEMLASPPDLIHGQHHVETMTALLHFANVPAVFFCHGWAPWVETPPRFPRILRYVAVDDTCRDRLLWEHGIPEPRVRVLLNFVDLKRFRPRGPLPPRPARALVFSNAASDSTYLPAVREACAQRGVALDVAGKQSGHVADAPEHLLGSYDLVFAKSRCAMEAMAVGAAVILCDAVGAGPLVTAAEVARLRRLNFGVRSLRNGLRPELLAREIDRYDARDAAEVTRWIRAEADLGRTVDEIVELYREVIAEHRNVPPGDAADAEARAAAAYLRWAAADMREEREFYKKEFEDFENSAAVRLYKRLRGAPLLGPLARRLARKLAP